METKMLPQHFSSGKKRNNRYKNLSSCKYCNYKGVIRKGFRKTKDRGKIQKFYCKSCKKYFTLDNGFFRMRNNEHKVTACLDMYFRGMSLRKIQEHLQAFTQHNSSHMTILRWIRKYCSQIGEFTNTLNLNVGHELMSDEMEYSTKGKQTWFVDVMDTTTRYIVSSDFMRSRTIENLINVLKLAKKKTGNQVKMVTTDGLKGYPRVLRKSFGLQSPHYPVSRPKSKIIHNVVIASERGFNHKIERLHGNIRERTKIFRGFGSLESARAIMKGYEIFHNFCRKHQGINKYPYELATDLALGKNKWLNLIKLANL